MNTSSGFKLHPEAAQDILDIWEFIANENVEAAGRVRVDILEAIRSLIPFPHIGHRRACGWRWRQTRARPSGPTREPKSGFRGPTGGPSRSDPVGPSYDPREGAESR